VIKVHHNESEEEAMAGRPRTKGLDEAIHRATLQLLAEVGYEKVSLAEVARRSGTAITTLYRRYDNVRELIIGSLRAEFATPLVDLEDTGSLTTDLKTYVAQFANELNQMRAAVLTALLLPMRDDPSLGEIVRNEILVVGRGQWDKLIQRAIARGELPESTYAPEILNLVVPSVIFQSTMVFHVDVHKAGILDDLVQLVLLPALIGQRFSSQGSIHRIRNINADDALL
jgi:AcrR family transcriptional regulator